MEQKVIRPTKPGVFPVLGNGVHNIALGNMTQYPIAVMRTEMGRLFIGVEGKGCYSFATPVDPSYVEGKLRILPGDSENIADLINCQIVQGEPRKVFGHYHDKLLAKA